MHFSQLFFVALQNIISNKLRTFLSMLGVIIWVITIILVYAIGSGATQQVQAQFKNLSVNTIFLFPMRWFELDEEAIDVIKTSPNIDQVAGFYQSNTNVANDTYNNSFSAVGMTSDMFNIVSVKLLQGTLFDQSAVENKERVVILGNSVFQQLYPDSNPRDIIGTAIIVNKKEFTVIAILEKSGGSFGMLQIDDAVYMPLTTFAKNLVNRKPPLRIAMLAKDTAQVSGAVADVTNLINQHYKIDEWSNSFRVIDAWSTVAAAQQNASMLSVLLIGIASIVFVVSGIGIMNVMFASVAERTKEIGILKSIWAPSSSILSQFLLESVILTGIGSIIGMWIGELIIYLDVLWSTLPMLRSWIGDITAMWFAIMTWLFFGRYPAWRASKLDPVDALRS